MRAAPVASAPGALAEWCRIAVATVSRSALALVCGAVLWAVAPALLGWQPTTVLTGSMAPRIHPGDVVVARPLQDAAIRPGQVLLFDDPDHPGRLRLHRVVRVTAAGVVTKGDANAAADSTPVHRSAVHGVGVLRLPGVGLPVLWARQGRWPAVVATAAAVAVLVLLAGVDAPVRRRTDDGPHDPGVRPRQRALGAALAVLAAVAGLSLVPAPPASAAPFRSATAVAASATAADLRAPSGLTCANGANGTVVISWSYAGDTPQSFDLVSGGTVLASAAGTARSTTYARTGLLELNTSYPLSVRTSLAGSWTAVSATSVPVTVVVVLGLAALQCA